MANSSHQAPGDSSGNSVHTELWHFMLGIAGITMSLSATSSTPLGTSPETHPRVLSTLRPTPPAHSNIPQPPRKALPSSQQENTPRHCPGYHPQTDLLLLQEKQETELGSCQLCSAMFIGHHLPPPKKKKCFHAEIFPFIEVVAQQPPDTPPPQPSDPGVSQTKQTAQLRPRTVVPTSQHRLEGFGKRS